MPKKRCPFHPNPKKNKKTKDKPYRCPHCGIWMERLF